MDSYNDTVRRRQHRVHYLVNREFCGEEWTCFVCYDILCDPVKLACCPAIACKVCLLRSVCTWKTQLNNPTPPCIHCGTRVNNIDEYVKGAKPEVGLKRVIDGLKVTCMNNANPKKGKSCCECNWVGKLGEFDSHSRNECQVRNDVDRAICLREPGKIYSVTFPMGEQPFGLRMGNRLINEKVTVGDTYYCVKDNEVTPSGMPVILLI